MLVKFGRSTVGQFWRSWCRFTPVPWGNPRTARSCQTVTSTTAYRFLIRHLDSWSLSGIWTLDAFKVFLHQPQFLTEVRRAGGVGRFREVLLQHLQVQTAQHQAVQNKVRLCMFWHSAQWYSALVQCIVVQCTSTLRRMLKLKTLKMFRAWHLYAWGLP